MNFLCLLVLTVGVCGTYNAAIETAALPCGAAGTTAFALLSCFEIGSLTVRLGKVLSVHDGCRKPDERGFALFVFFDN